MEGSNKESNRRQDGQPEARDRFYFKHNCCLYWIVQQALCHFASFYVFSFKHNYCLYLVVQQTLNFVFFCYNSKHNCCLCLVVLKTFCAKTLNQVSLVIFSLETQFLASSCQLCFFCALHTLPPVSVFSFSPYVGLAMMPIQLNLSTILADSIRTYFSTIIHRLSFNLFFWIHHNTITHFLFFWTQMSCGILSWDHHYTATLGTSFTTMVGGSGRETPHCIVDNNFVWNLQFKICTK